MSFHALVIGANSTIAKAAIQQLENDPLCQGVFSVSRTVSNSEESLTRKTVWIACDYSASSIEEACKLISSKSVLITKVLICNGVLHNDTMMPEKKLEDINQQQLEHTLYANTITPMLWLSQLMPILRGKEPTQVAIFSARVGSISDNNMGGWYSYRASKAALNMLIKTSAIEYARRAKNVKLMAFHPGTTDTPLSKPFQSSVPKGKLFTAEFVAKQLLDIMNTVPMDNEASFLDWNNKSIDW
ncbi:SDR family NAD(P)-dependent oxidoreductase [Marinomonas sp. C2222]|uniref:SDR family NAD(P)-dependent oxidoreductase n=1 Tax=Marinomonas sargassi TaxID=2984494 RepID=A0ABT2YNY9_9GAMM|nr:SDR family NAD(P)-dependent oxidoreductase [Marinomonas sargassi]MCV2401604.1 SDR family NAD(P)-dependent oxidoreductase [Marinomonas sargassi]